MLFEAGERASGVVVLFYDVGVFTVKIHRVTLV